jgi:ribosomal protein S18 acetylase RimI-like enzyme
VSAEVELERALAFCRELAVRCATRVQELSSGTAVANEGLPSVWDLNVVWLDTVPADVTAERLAEDVEAAQAALAHRKLIVADGAAGARLAEGFAALGWEVDVVLVMTATPPYDGEASPHTVIEVDEPGQRAYRDEWVREWPESSSDSVAAQLLAHKRIVADAVETRFFLGLADGEPASACELYVRDGIGQIEDVGTLTRYRGRGLARALVLHALGEARAAGCDLVFLLADGEDWPKNFYGRLGFVPVGRYFAFLRKPT